MNEQTMEDIINYVSEKEKLAWESKALWDDEHKPVNGYAASSVAWLLGEVVTKLKKLAANQPQTSSLPDSETPSSESNADEDKSGSCRVGFVGNKTTSVYYNFLNNLDIQVTAREIKTGQWTIEGRNRTEVRIVATVFGGCNTANKFARFIRDGMVSRSMKIKRYHKRRAERMAEAATKEVAK